MNVLTVKKILLSTMLVLSTAVVIMTGTDFDVSEYNPAAQTSTTWNLSGANMVTNGLGSDKTFNEVTYGLTSSATSPPAPTLVGTYARLGGPANNAKADTVTLSFPAVPTPSQPWNSSSTRVTGIKIFAYADGNSNTFQVNINGSPILSPALTFGATPAAGPGEPFEPSSAAIPNNVFNQTISIVFVVSASYLYLDNLQITYGDAIAPLSLEVIQFPKRNYFPGELFDDTDLQVRAYFDVEKTIFEDNYQNYSLLYPAGPLCQTTSVIQVQSTINSAINTSFSITVTGGGYYSSLVTTLGTPTLPTPTIYFRDGDLFETTSIIIYGYLSCLSSSNQLQTERLEYDATGDRGFKVLDTNNDPIIVGSPLLEGVYNVKAVYSGTQAPNPDVNLLPSPTVEIPFSLTVVGEDDPVINETPTSESTFIGPTTNGFIKTNIGGIDWYLLVTFTGPGVTVSYDSTRGTKISGANSLRLISDPYNYLGDALIRSTAFTVSTSELPSSALLKNKIGNAYSPDEYTLVNNTTNVAYTFNDYPDDFNLVESSIGYAYGQIALEASNLGGGAFYVKIVNVESQRNNDVYRTQQFASFLRDFATCDVTPEDVTEIETEYTLIFGQTINPYLNTYYIYDRAEFAATETSPFAATVSVANKFTYITGNPVQQAYNLNGRSFQSQELRPMIMISALILISLFGTVTLLKYFS